MRSPSNRSFLKLIIIPLIIVLFTTVGYILYRTFKGSTVRSSRVISWIRNPFSNPEWVMEALTRCDPAFPFLFPTDGYVGFLWDDSFRPGHQHQGIDIFSSKKSGETPVYSAYEGYLTRYQIGNPQ